MNRFLIVALLVSAGVLVSAAVHGKTAKEVFAEVSGGIVVVIAMNASGEEFSQGSGVVVSETNVATNCHVISGAEEVFVRQAVGRSGRESYRMEARLIEQDKARDLCLLFVEELPDPPAATPVTLGAARGLSVGEEVYAIGVPLGLELSLSRGVVSQLRARDGKRAALIIQTDAAILPGSLGGGLFDDQGGSLESRLEWLPANTPKGFHSRYRWNG